jgi:hypothetical protein
VLQNVVQADAAVGQCLPPRPHGGDDLPNARGIPRCSRDQFSDRPAVHGDDEALAPLHAFEQLRQVCSRVAGTDVRH